MGGLRKLAWFTGDGRIFEFRRMGCSVFLVVRMRPKEARDLHERGRAYQCHTMKLFTLAVHRRCVNRWSRSGAGLHCQTVQLSQSIDFEMDGIAGADAGAGGSSAGVGAWD